MPDDSKKQRPPLARRNSSMLGVELKQGNASMPSIDKLGFIKMLPPLLMLPGLSVVLYGAMAWQTYVRGNTALYDKQYAARNSLRNSAQISDGLSVNSQDREASSTASRGGRTSPRRCSPWSPAGSTRIR